MIYLIYILFLLLPFLEFRPLPPAKFITLFDIIFFLLLFIWISESLKSKNKIFFKTHYKSAFIIIVIGSILSSLFATNVLSSVFGFVVMLKYYILLQILIRYIDSDEKIDNILFILSIGVAISAIIGILQFNFGINIQINPDQSLNQNTEFTVSRKSFIRIYGPFSNSLNFAMYLSVTIFVFLSNINRKKYIIIFSMIGFVVTLISLVQTLSRAPLIFAILSLILLLFLKSGKKIYVYLLFVFLSLSSIFTIMDERIDDYLPDTLLTRFYQLENIENNARYKLWLNAFDRLDENILGVGFKNIDYKINWPPFVHSTEGYLPRETSFWKPFNFHFENVYLAIYMNIGFLGLIGLLYLIYMSLLKSLKIYFNLEYNYDKNRILIVIIMIISIILNFITNPSILSDIRIMILFWCTLALNNNLINLGMNYRGGS